MAKKPIEPKAVGTVTALYAKRNHEKSEPSERRERLRFVVGEGILVDRHHGLYMAAGPREPILTRALGFDKKEDLMFNLRQVSVVSEEELAITARRLGIEEEGVPGGALFENIVVSGIPKLSHLPHGTRLAFKNSNGDVTLVLYCTGRNGPCAGPAKIIADLRGLPVKDTVRIFTDDEGQYLRGIVAFVQATGQDAFVHEGDTVEVYGPEQNHE